jgi:hypothetical protein
MPDRIIKPAFGIGAGSQAKPMTGIRKEMVFNIRACRLGCLYLIFEKFNTANSV